MIDETHAFLKEPAKVTENGVSTPYEFVRNTFKVIGTSATFGGEQVKRDLLRTFEDSSFLKTPTTCIQRELKFEVVGQLSQKEIVR